MRLLTTTEPWRFVETYEPPPYAILSHTWMTTDSGESQEVSYQELRAYMEDPAKQTNTTLKPGFEKIKEAIHYATQRTHNLIWIDTCCIDKTNQLELDEAIRCMFKWYQDATICYAYLSDVKTGRNLHMEVCSSRWFTRGWTLQELVAPRNVHFIAKDWSYIDNRKSRRTFGNILLEASGISKEVLNGRLAMSEISISERMRWAARRQTTRIEDLAYSLMGIFGVHMPIMYGEGKDAFIRLQKEILRNSDDPSIFAWESPLDYHNQIRGLLAESPECFGNAESFQQSNGFDASYDEWQDTNRGLRLRLLIHPCKENTDNTDYFAHLDCFYNDLAGTKRPMLRLRHLGGDEFARVHTTRIFWRISDDPEPRAERITLFVKHSPLYRQPQIIVAPQHLSRHETNSIFGYTVENETNSIFRYTLENVCPKEYWDGTKFYTERALSSKSQVAVFRFQRIGGAELYLDVVIGFDYEGLGKWSPWCIQKSCSEPPQAITTVHRLMQSRTEPVETRSRSTSYSTMADLGRGIHSRATLSSYQLLIGRPSYTLSVEPPAEIP